MMRRLISGAAAAAILLGGAAAAQQPANPPQFSPERIKSDVTFLADDLLEGRGNGSRGYEIAARFVASRFAALGLEPGNNSAGNKA